MPSDRQNNYLLSWIESLQAKGYNTFSYAQVLNHFNDLQEPAIKSSLTRIVRKKKIVSLYKGFYIILKPEDYARGVIPPLLFIDSLMEHLQKPYYVGLLSAASLYGAAHQRPQEFFVVTRFPQLRPTIKKGIKINYISRVKILERYLIKRKIETGYVNVSSPELTAIDLIEYQRHIGGLNRVTTILRELAGQIVKEKIDAGFVSCFPTAYLQRLGYILENHTDYHELANILYVEILHCKKLIPRQALNPEEKIAGFVTDKKWRLILNTQIEPDE